MGSIRGLRDSMKVQTIDELRALARRLRVHVLTMTHRAKSSHVGGGLSMADILAVLYGDVLKVDPKAPQWPGRDRFVLSKGHACAALYAVLAERGFFPLADLETFYQDGSALSGHATHIGVPGVECSTGSLGHGLSIACGMAVAGKKAASPFRVFAIISDGECDEGSIWEAALFAGHHQLDNVTVIVDYNRIQSLGHTNEVLCLDPLTDKWRSFGWHTVEIDGHSVEQLQTVLSSVPLAEGKPTCLVANTVKGKGVSFMENQLLWHYRAPQGDEYTRALAELGVVHE
jgi:transketolase